MTPAAPRLPRLLLAAASLLAFPLLFRAAVPPWAYGFTTPAAPGEKAKPPGPNAPGLKPGENAAELTRKHRIPGATGEYSVLEIRNGNNVVDWFPEDHPEMSPLMRNGPARLGDQGMGCAFCHLPNGKGKPENAPVSGLPVAYFVRQLQDMRHGLRTSADPRKANTLRMIELAQAMTDAEMREAAEYFAGMPSTPWVKVVETDRVPRTKIVSGLFVPIEEKPTEPLGGRIIEVPEQPEQTELLRNPRAGFIAYVPRGSVERGRILATTGGARMVDGRPVEGTGRTVACNTCHGLDLNGLAEVPGIAGRSPSYLARQMYDIKHGTRKSPLSQLMLPVVANLTDDDITALVAYVASVEP